MRKFHIPAHFRSFPSVASGQAGQAARLGPYWGHGWVAVELAADFVFCGHNRTFRALGSRLCGSGGWVRKFHIPAHSRSFPSVASGQAGGRLFAGDRSGDTVGSLSAGRLILFFCGRNRTFTGTGFPPMREWRLGAEISYSRSFPLVSAHFRALPPLRRGELFAGDRTGEMVWVAVELAADFVFCGHNRTFPGTGRVPAGRRG